MPKFVKGQPRPANAGRKKGTQNRATIERNKAKDEAMNAEANESPRDYMLRIMRSLPGSACPFYGRHWRRARTAGGSGPAWLP